MLLAAALLDLIGPVLDELPLAYLLRIEVGNGTTFQRTRPANAKQRVSAPTAVASPHGLEP